MSDEPVDLVGTVRMGEWAEWVGEAAAHWTSRRPVIWWSRHALARRAAAGSRFYVVSEGRLRCYAVLGRRQERIARRCPRGEWVPLCPEAPPPGETGIVPVTVDGGIRGFRGLRRRWWPREIERPCPDWQGAALGLEEGEL